MNQEKKGVILCLVAAFCYAFGPILSKLLYGSGLPWQVVVSCRGMIPGILVLVYALLFTRQIFHIKKEHLPWFILNSLVFAFISIFHYYSLFYIKAAVTAVILCTIPVFTMILSRLVLKERFTVGKLIALVFVFSGTLLIMNLTHMDSIAADPGSKILGLPGALFGVIGALLSSICGALYNVFTRKLNLEYGGWTVNAWCYMLSFPIFLIIGGRVLQSFQWQPQTALTVLLMAAVGLAAYSFFAMGLHYVDAGKASLLETMNPVLSVMMSIMILGETLVPIEIAGCVCVGIGLLVMDKDRLLPKRLKS